MNIHILPSVQLLTNILLLYAWTALGSLHKKAYKQVPIDDLLFIYHRKPDLGFWTLAAVMEMTATSVHLAWAGKASKDFVAFRDA